MLLNTILKLWKIISDGMQDVYSTLNTTFSDLLIVDNEVVQAIINGIVNSIGIGEWTVLDFMFGIGLPFIFTFVIIKWLIDIVP